MPSRTINSIAADWVAKMEAGGMTPEERRELDLWLAADIRHLGAFTRTAAAVASLDPLRAIGGDEVRQLCAPAQPQTWTRRRIVWTGGGAAGLAAAGIAGVLFNKPGSREPAVGPRNAVVASATEYATKIGSTRVIPLSDGSVVTLNTDSRVIVRYEERVREVHLVHGEAFFSVAKNKQRPFIVVAGGTRVRAVGTSFSVRFLQERPLLVLVQEGVVEVARSDHAGAKTVLAAAQTQTVVPPSAPIAMRNITYAQVARGVAWQYGQISFDNETLGDAAREFARYNMTRIVVDPAVADLTVSGLFPSDNPAGFAKAAAAALGLHAEVKGGEVKILRQI